MNIIFQKEGQPLKISSHTFKNNTNITEIELPEYLTQIGLGAFEGCTNLSKISVPFIGESVNENTNFAYLFGCTKILGENATDSETQEYRDEINGLSLPTSLEVIVIGNLKIIPAFSFHYLSFIKKCFVSDEITTIGRAAFNNFNSEKGLEEFNMPSKVTKINNSAFAYIPSLKKLNWYTYEWQGNIGSTWKDGNSQNLTCYGYKYAKWDEKAQTTKNEVYQKQASDKEEGIYLLDSNNNKVAVKTLAYQQFSTIVEQGGKCGDNLFYQLNADNTKLTITGQGKMWNFSEVSKVPWYQARKNITSIVLPPDITSIGDYAFYETKISTISNMSKVESIGKYSFSGCENLSSLPNLNNNVRLDTMCFSNCTILKSFDFPKNYYTSIDNYGQLYNSGVNQLKFYGKVYSQDSIYKYFISSSTASMSARKFERIEFQSGTIHSKTFSNFNSCDSSYNIGTLKILKDCIVEKGCLNTENSDKKQQLYIYSLDCDIGEISIDYLFYMSKFGSPNYNFIKEVYYRNSYSNKIPTSFFSYSELLYSYIYISENINVFEEECFYDNIGFIIRSEGKNYLDFSNIKYIGNNAFVKNPIYSSNSEYFEIPPNGILNFNQIEYIGQNTFINVASDIKEISIKGNENDITIVAENFKGCSNLTSLIFDSNIRNLTIGDNAFYGCNKLTSLIFDSNIRNLTIGNNAFLGNQLVNLILPKSTSHIGINAFQCETLKNITLPLLWEEGIGNHIGAIFYYEKNFKHSEVWEYTYWFFYNKSNNCYFRVPKSLLTVMYNNVNSLMLGQRENFQYFSYLSQTDCNINTITFKTLTKATVKTIFDSGAFQNCTATLVCSDGNLDYTTSGATAKNYENSLRAGGNSVTPYALPNSNTSLNLLSIINNKEYAWKGYLYSDKYDVYITDNNTYADGYSYLPKIYVPNNEKMQVGHRITLQGENTYDIEKIETFNYTNKIFYRQTKGIIEGSLTYYATLTGRLTYEQNGAWTIEDELRPFLSENKIRFSTGSKFDVDLLKGTISMVNGIVQVDLTEGSDIQYGWNDIISLEKAKVKEASLPTEMIDIVKTGTKFTVTVDNTVQEIKSINDYYNISFTPGFEVSGTGYNSVQMTLADKNLILSNNLNTNQVAVVIDTTGRILINGDLNQEVNVATVEGSLIDLMKVDNTNQENSTWFVLNNGVTYYINSINKNTKEITFSDKLNKGYTIEQTNELWHDIILHNYIDIASKEDFDLTDLHLTLNYINIYDIDSISLYDKSTANFGLKHGEKLYAITCKSVLRAQDFEVSERSLEKEMTIERYSSILTVKNLDDTPIQNTLVAANTGYYIYSNYIITPPYYFQTVDKGTVTLSINGTQRQGNNFNINGGGADFTVEYDGNISYYIWTLKEKYEGVEIERDRVENRYSSHIYYNCYLLDNTEYVLTLEIMTKEGLLVTTNYNLFVNYTMTSKGRVAKDACKKQAIYINIDTNIMTSDVKSYYILRQEKDNPDTKIVLAKGNQVGTFYDYSTSRELEYNYFILLQYTSGNYSPLYYVNNIEGGRDISLKVCNIMLLGTLVDFSEEEENINLQNKYEADTSAYNCWIFRYNTEAKNVSVNTDKVVYDNYSSFATVNKTNRNYKSGTITAFLGSYYNENEECDETMFKKNLKNWTYRDSVVLQNKLQAFANNGKIKMLRDEIGNVIPVDITVKSFDYNPLAIPSNISVSFEWTQVASEENFAIYKIE